MPKTCVLFDFDGVIANTESRNAAYLGRALRQYGIVLSDADRQAMIGVNDRTVLADLLARAGAPIAPEAFLEARRRLGNSYEDGSIRPMPGVRKLLCSIRGAGLKIGLVSSTSTRLIIAALNHMDMIRLFDGIVCGDMVERHKPEPDAYQLAMRFLGVRPEECVVIEDSTVGIHAGHAAGAFVIAYRGSGIAQDVHEADCVMNNFSEYFSLAEKYIL